MRNTNLALDAEVVLDSYDVLVLLEEIHAQTLLGKHSVRGVLSLEIENDLVEPFIFSFGDVNATESEDRFPVVITLDESAKTATRYEE